MIKNKNISAYLSKLRKLKLGIQFVECIVITTIAAVSKSDLRHYLTLITAIDKSSSSNI